MTMVMANAGKSVSLNACECISYASYRALPTVPLSAALSLVLLLRGVRVPQISHTEQTAVKNSQKDIWQVSFPLLALLLLLLASSIAVIVKDVLATLLPLLLLMEPGEPVGDPAAIGEPAGELLLLLLLLVFVTAGRTRGVISIEKA